MKYYSKYLGEKLLKSLKLDESCLKQLDPPNTTYFGRRLSQVCKTVPIWENFQLSWFLRGQRGFHPDSNPVLSPPFLTREGFLKLKVSENKYYEILKASHHSIPDTTMIINDLMAA